MKKLNLKLTARSYLNNNRSLKKKCVCLFILGCFLSFPVVAAEGGMEKTKQNTHKIPKHNAKLKPLPTKTKPNLKDGQKRKGKTTTNLVCLSTQVEKTQIN